MSAATHLGSQSLSVQRIFVEDVANPLDCTFLQRLTTALDDAPAQINACNSKSTWQHVAAVTSVLAFVVFAAGTFVVVGIYAPFYLPFVSAAAFIGQQKSLSLYKQLMSYASENKKAANGLGAVYSELQKVPCKAEKIQEALEQMGVPEKTIPADENKLISLRSLLALYRTREQETLFVQSKVDEIKHWVDEFKEEINALSAQAKKATSLTEGEVLLPEKQLELSEAEDSRQKLLRLQEWWKANAQPLKKRAYNVEHLALTLKTQQAFIHAIIQRPDFAGAFKNLAQIDNKSFEDRELAFASSEKPDNFLTFVPPSTDEPIPWEAMRDHGNLPVEILAQYFVRAIQAFQKQQPKTA